jgi:threonine/homoserine efflux transporter RhtA
MTIPSYTIQPVIALVAGLLILVQPMLLHYIVAIYLIVIGVMGLVPRAR